MSHKAGDTLFRSFEFPKFEIQSLKEFELAKKGILFVWNYCSDSPAVKKRIIREYNVFAMLRQLRDQGLEETREPTSYVLLVNLSFRSPSDGVYPKIFAF